jgi:hypothetical protein
LAKNANIFVIKYILFACERRQYDEQAGEEEKNNRQLAQFRAAFPLRTKHRARIHGRRNSKSLKKSPTRILTATNRLEN